MVTLEASRLFCQLTPEELRALRWVVKEKRFAAGEEIFKEGDPGDGIYVVKEGLVQISASIGPEARRVFSEIKPGDFFGELAVLDYKQRSAWAVAATETTAYFVPRLEILKFIERSPVLAMSLLREISNRLRDFSRHYVREAVEMERLAAVGRFAQGILHDLKNPLNIINMTAERLGKRRGESGTGTGAEAAKAIRKQVGHITDLVSEVLTYTRGAGAESDLVLAPADYGAFVRQLVAELRPDLALRQARLEVGGALPTCVLQINPKRLTRVFYNLAYNAADAMPDGGRITLRVRKHPGEVITELEDGGPGLAPEVAARLFEPFATHGKSQGTGLGLSICKRIVEDHHGWISARNAPSGGAVFAFGLPLGSTEINRNESHPTPA